MAWVFLRLQSLSINQNTRPKYNLVSQIILILSRLKVIDSFTFRFRRSRRKLVINLFILPSTLPPHSPLAYLEIYPRIIRAAPVTPPVTRGRLDETITRSGPPTIPLTICVTF